MPRAASPVLSFVGLRHFRRGPAPSVAVTQGNGPDGGDLSRPRPLARTSCREAFHPLGPTGGCERPFLHPWGKAPDHSKGDRARGPASFERKRPPKARKRKAEALRAGAAPERAESGEGAGPGAVGGA